jgi:uncharacterized membrane protein
MVPAMEQNQVPVQSCPDCAAQMPVGARFCPACGRSMQMVERARGRVGALKQNVAAGLAYFAVLPALLFFFKDPYRRDLFIRFHALQSFLFTIAAILIGFALWLAGMALFVIPVLGPLLVVVIVVVTALAVFFLWLTLVIKAFQGVTFKLPALGRLAEHYASRS